MYGLVVGSAVWSWELHSVMRADPSVMGCGSPYAQGPSYVQQQTWFLLPKFMAFQDL